MFDPIRLVNDLFERRTISDARLRAYANDHLLRLGNNNPGSVYTPLIDATTSAYQAYFGSITSAATKAAVKEGRTVGMKQARTALLNGLRKQRNLVVYLFGKDGDTYQEFFPLGINAFKKAKLDGLTTMMETYLKAADTHLMADHATEVAAIHSLAEAYEQARKDQLAAKSSTDTQRTQRREHRKALTRQLTRNLLLLAADLIDNTDGFDDYFDLTILTKRSGRKKSKDNGQSMTES